MFVAMLAVNSCARFAVQSLLFLSRSRRVTAANLGVKACVPRDSSRPLIWVPSPDLLARRGVAVGLDRAAHREVRTLDGKIHVRKARESMQTLITPQTCRG